MRFVDVFIYSEYSQKRYTKKNQINSKWICRANYICKDFFIFKTKTKKTICFVERKKNAVDTYNRTETELEKPASCLDIYFTM